MSPGQYVPQEVRAKCLPAGQGKMSPKIETRQKSGQFVPQGNMSSGQFVPQPDFVTPKTQHAQTNCGDYEHRHVLIVKVRGCFPHFV